MDLINERIRQQSRALDKQLENEVKKLLKEKGFKFDTQQEFYKFISERCQLSPGQENTEKVIFMDGKFLCSWNDSYNTIYDGLTAKSTFNRTIKAAH
ncbi:MAG: hypothetical protein N4A71_22080 [Carboxylicivirga sp.]|jgi:hypothetical protein|nr:hypothetical protein [Carboxylicivirga sp.]